MNFPRDRYIGDTCKVCGDGEYGPTDHNSEWWVKCTECKSMLFCYIPMPHQYTFHQDNHKFRMWAGGKIFQSRLKTNQIRGNSKGVVTA
jgi:hypothetical protein